MASYTGVVKRNDLEGGFWELVTDDGERYQLRGGDSRLHQDGQRVTVRGRIDRAAFGIGMTGPYLDVESWEAA